MFYNFESNRNWVKDERKTGKLPVRTMGHAKTPLNPPQEYLKKRERTKTPLPKTDGFKYGVFILRR